MTDDPPKPEPEPDDEKPQPAVEPAAQPAAPASDAAPAAEAAPAGAAAQSADAAPAADGAPAAAPAPTSTSTSTPKPAAPKPAAPRSAKPAGKRLPQADFWDRHGATILRYAPLPLLAAITIGVFAIHAHIFQGETAGDDLTFHFAESARIADCLRHGDFDFWNPSANAGYASAYYYQVVPQLASALPAAIFGHHLFWFQLSVVLPLVMAPIAAYRAMRVLGASPWQSVTAAFCVAFMNGASRWGAGNAGTFMVGLYTQTWALSAFPLALAHGARWLSQGKGLAPAVAWGAFVFLCHPFAGATLGLAIIAGWVALCVMRGADRFVLRPLLHRPPHDDGGAPLLKELARGAILAGLLLITWLPVLVPLAIDREGFGGFPHRVNDEVGPGFLGLWRWIYHGEVLDFSPAQISFRLPILTCAVPIMIVFARGKFLRWLWAPALLYAVLLGLGPNLGKIGDDLFPPVRALGAMQTVLAMAVGAGAVDVGIKLWKLTSRSIVYEYGLQTALAAVACAAVILILVPGTQALVARVHVLEDLSNQHADEMEVVNEALAKQPPGRKQTGTGTENHWWNLLSYAYERVPSLFQMGGGGLQASPNYDFLWTSRDMVKNAWIFDAPYVVFDRAHGENMPLGATIMRTEHYELRRLPSPGLVSPVQVTGTLPPGYRNGQPGHLAALEWIRGKDPLQDKVLAYDGSGGAGDPPDGKTIRAWQQDSPGDQADIVAELDVNKPSTFTVRESWHPRWHAYLDGDEIKVRRVTPDFMAVDVGPGKHTLEMRFERPWWAQAVWLLWPGCVLAVWLVMRRRERPRLPAAQALDGKAA